MDARHQQGIVGVLVRINAYVLGKLQRWHLEQLSKMVFG
jgi:hypothetical protein